MATGHHYTDGQCVTCKTMATAEDYFTFVLQSDGTYRIKAKDNSQMPQHVDLPSAYNGKAVTSIDSSEFWFCSNLQNITIPDSVTSIGEYAFYYCTNLQNIEIPDSVTSIDKNAFYLCNSLKTITFKGTCAEWEAIQIGYLGKDFTIQCTDGTRYYKDS